MNAAKKANIVAVSPLQYQRSAGFKSAIGTDVPFAARLPLKVNNATAASLFVWPKQSDLRLYQLGLQNDSVGSVYGLRA